MDTAPKNRPELEALIEGSIGELSLFHPTFAALLREQIVHEPEITTAIRHTRLADSIRSSILAWLARIPSTP